VIDLLLAACRAVLATVAAMLPRRYWPALEPYVPVWRGALPAAAITALAGGTLGITGFLEFLRDVIPANQAAYLAAAGRAPTATLPLPSSLAVLSVFVFILLTPVGWLSTYLTVSGMARLAEALIDEPRGDYALTVVDAAVRRAWRRGSRRMAVERRHAREGPAVRDRVVPGRRLQIPAAELVVVASRVKDGWELGAVVLSDRGEFRIVHVEDRTIDGRLRRLYGLAPHRDLEVFRRTLRYTFGAEDRG